MKKMVKNLLPIFFILINTINVSAITYAELEEEQRTTYDILINCYNENNIELFVEILATGNNFELTNVSEQSLAKTIIENHTNCEIEKDDFIYTLFLYRMLSEVVQQVNEGTRIRRFREINQSLEERIESSQFIYPKEILSSERPEEKPTSFYWYIWKKVIEKKIILNPCFKQSLNWFFDRTIMFAWNLKIKKVMKNLERVPFMVMIKRKNSSFTDIIIKEFPEEQAEKIAQIIEKIKERFKQIEPSAWTSFFRYSLFT